MVYKVDIKKDMDQFATCINSITKEDVNMHQKQGTKKNISNKYNNTQSIANQRFI